MSTVTVSIQINRPAPVAFSYIADMSNNTKWQNGQESCEWTSDPPIGLGSTYDQTARFLAKEIKSSFEVVEFEPGAKIRIRTTGGTMPIDVTRTVTPVDDSRCTVAATVIGKPPMVMRMLGPLLDMMVRSSIRKDYQRLKELLESGFESEQD